MEIQEIQVAHYDVDGNLVEIETRQIEVEIPQQVIDRRNAVTAYKESKAIVEAGPLSMVKLREQVDAMEAIIATMIPELEEESE